MDILKAAIHKTAHHCGVNAKTLSEAVKISYPTFLNKTCMTNNDHQLSVFQAVDIQLATNSRHIHHAMGVLLDEQSVPTTAAAPVDLMSAVLRVGAAHGNINQVIERSLSNDNMVDMEELQECIASVAVGMQDLLTLQRALVAAAKNKTVIQ